MPLLRLFLDICLLRKGPQDVPVSPFLFRLVLGIYLAIGVLLLAPDTGWLSAVEQTTLEAALNLGLVAALLFTAKRLNRFQQTATALLGTDALISAAGLSLLQLLEQTGVGAIVWMGFLGWHIAIIAHILRLALNRSMAIGFAISGLYTVALFWVMYSLFPPP